MKLEIILLSFLCMYTSARPASDENNQDLQENNFQAPSVRDNVQDVIINKQFYLHSAPNEVDYDFSKFKPTPRPRVKIYFIALPPRPSDDVNTLQELEEETIVFVVKKKKYPQLVTSTEANNYDWKNEISNHETNEIQEQQDEVEQVNGDDFEQNIDYNA